MVKRIRYKGQIYEAVDSNILTDTVREVRLLYKGDINWLPKYIKQYNDNQYWVDERGRREDTRIVLNDVWWSEDNIHKSHAVRPVLKISPIDGLGFGSVIKINGKDYIYYKSYSADYAYALYNDGPIFSIWDNDSVAYP